jgi:hypothetical protein
MQTTGGAGMTAKTVVRMFSNRKDAERAVKQFEAQGWSVVSFQVNNKSQGWGFFKTCCLGAIFLPLALFGKKPDQSEYVVTFTKEA